jgi:hypothetical protein
LIYVLWSYNAIKQHLYFHTLLNFDCLTYNCLCKQPKDYQGLSQLKTQQGWFLLIDLPKDLEQHRVVHKCFSCIYSPPLFNSYCFQWFVCTAQYFVITVIWSSQQCIVGSIYISLGMHILSPLIYSSIWSEKKGYECWVSLNKISDSFLSTWSHIEIIKWNIELEQ